MSLLCRACKHSTPNHHSNSLPHTHITHAGNPHQGEEGTYGLGVYHPHGQHPMGPPTTRHPKHLYNGTNNHICIFFISLMPTYIFHASLLTTSTPYISFITTYATLLPTTAQTNYAYKPSSYVSPSTTTQSPSILGNGIINNFAKYGANKPPLQCTQSTSPFSSIPLYSQKTHIPHPSNALDLTYKLNTLVNSPPQYYPCIHILQNGSTTHSSTQSFPITYGLIHALKV